MEKLRFTGEWPSPKHWAKFPNWELAGDEEGVECQDEGTLRPCEVQEYIAGPFTYFTAGDVTQANGLTLPAFLQLFDSGISEINVFVRDDEQWTLWFREKERKWEPWSPSWLPESMRRHAVSLANVQVFPLLVLTRLPFEPGGQPIRFIINQDGTESFA